MKKHIGHVKNGGVCLGRKIGGIGEQKDKAVKEKFLKFQAVILAHCFYAIQTAGITVTRATMPAVSRLRGRVVRGTGFSIVYKQGRV